MATTISHNIPTNPEGPEEEIHAELERCFIDDYLKRKGFTAERLSRLSEDETRRIMSEASTYASGKLTEIESRDGFKRSIKGTGQNQVS